MSTTCRRVFDHYPLRAETLGPVLSAMWFSYEDPMDEDLRQVAELAAAHGCGEWFLRRMENKGANPNQRQSWSSPNCPLVWQALENSLRYEFRRDEGAAPGLFLDQRQQRKWVLESSKDLRVLNLFAYTGGFSVAAAKGGAKEVVTVDLSKRYIEWAKANFLANDLSVEAFEFWTADARMFLAGSRRRQRVFDLIICDPPSFSRSERGVFQVEKDFKELLDSCLDVLAPKGRLQFSCNLQKWERAQFKKDMSDYAGIKRLELTFPPLPEDFKDAYDASHMAVFHRHP